ncbi:MAG TPA: nucleotide-binding protein [Methanoregulaceae archaeon]|nr:nucleotide-binding protein [Methanoregulaceae archaeon]HQA79504.1 nucleotide-binding protein [Methanoregulaceae archaeon]
MKIGTTNVRISTIHVMVVAIFTIFLMYAYFISRDTRMLIWGIATLILLLLIPLGLNYMSQKEYAEFRPQYEREARSTRIKLINTNMVGEPVRIEGLVEKVRFQFLNRPQYMIADRSGEISVRMYTQPEERINVGDVVEVLGSVMKRYIVSGDAIINGISIKKINKTNDTKNTGKGK